MASRSETRDARSDARAAFLTGLIDDAGLFPPARLPMDKAVASHVASKLGPYSWMMGRFLCPASRLSELLKHLPEGNRPDGRPWGIGVVMDGAAERWNGGVAHDLAAARAFEEQAAGTARIELLEARLPAVLAEEADPGVVAAEVRGFVDLADHSGLKGPVAPFFEVSRGLGWRRSTPAVLWGISEAREAPPEGICQTPGAKLRCGGLVVEAFPSPEQVATFVAACTRFGVPMKATAGLHHPFRHVDEETGFVQHGFVNLLGAAVLAASHGLPDAELEELVADDNASNFSIATDGFRWRSHKAGADDVARARTGLFVAYGSCSFAEPVEDLVALGILPVAA